MLINNLKLFLDEWNNAASALPFSFEKFKALDIYLFGINEQSENLINLLPIQGYIDDFTSDSEHDGIPIVSLEQVLGSNNEYVVINCVLNTKPRTAMKRLKEVGIDNFVNYSEISRVYNEIPLPEFVANSRKCIFTRATEWASLYDKLTDSDSQRVLLDILKYRITGDPLILADYDYRPKDQYFESFMNYKEEVFIDAGGYIGDTSEEFCARYPDYHKVYLFEPNSQNIALAKKALSSYKNIEFIEKGVSDKEEVLCFSGDGSSTTVNENGDIRINVVPIDNEVKERITLIKMDLEGWELNALKGASRHIVEDHPKLAIAVYHSPDDFLELSNYILSLRDDYELFLRHYTESWTETVMYFKPKS